MERPKLLFLLAVFALWGPLVLAQSRLSLLKAVERPDDDRRRVQTYIVHVQKPKSLVLRGAREREDWHRSFLPSLALDSGELRLVYSYEHAIGGFAARLTPEEAEAMEDTDGVLSVQPDSKLTPRTTHSQKFLGLTRSGQLWEKSDGGRGKVIGVLEFGFYSGHKSFTSGYYMPEPPDSWKGKCTFKPENCSKKLIGNKLFNNSGPYDPNWTYVMHGTHVASIAAGVPVSAHYEGLGCGAAIGAAPLAHLAFYSVNAISDSLKAVDEAINDGVHVLSISIGTFPIPPFHSNNLDIATLSAVKHGVFVSVAVGNEGPRPRSIEDNTPWTLSVGASTTDRVNRVEIRLRNGDVINGETSNSEYLFVPVGTNFPVIFPGGLTGNVNVSHCYDPDFGGVDVTGKVVLCLQGSIKTSEYSQGGTNCGVYHSGGKALILLNEKTPGSTVTYDGTCRIPSVYVQYDEAQRLKAYAVSDPDPTLSFEPMGTIAGVHRHPAVADFSSRGPSTINNMVLKPETFGKV